MRFTRTTAVAFVAASLAFVAACGKTTDGGSGGASPSPSPSPSPTPSATEQLTASIKDFSTMPYKYKLNLSVGIDVAGSEDPTAGSLSQQAKVDLGGSNITFDLIVAGGQYYAKIGGVPVPGVNTSKWLHVDPSKLKTVHNLLISDVKDPTGVQAINKSVVSAEQTGEGQFKGTLDLTKGGDDIPGVDSGDFTALGDKAKAVPFEATVDKGRLATFKISVPAAGSSPAVMINFTYSDFGTAVSVAKPAAAQTIEAPAAAYTFLNSN
jgi:hypothetical protein